MRVLLVFDLGSRCVFLILPKVAAWAKKALVTGQAPCLHGKTPALKATRQ